MRQLLHCIVGAAIPDNGEAHSPPATNNVANHIFLGLRWTHNPLWRHKKNHRINYPNFNSLQCHVTMYVQCTLYRCAILWCNKKYLQISYPNCVLLFQYWYFCLKIMVWAQRASCATINALKKTNFIKKVKEKGWCNEIHAFHIAIFLLTGQRFVSSNT